MKKANLDYSSLGFGYVKTNSYVKSVYKEGKWSKIEIVKDETINIHIAATSLHYGQSAFEGLKVFETVNKEIVAFRPIENQIRMAYSANKVRMAVVPEALFMEALNIVVRENQEYIPPYGSNASLYIRPLLYGSGPKVGVQASDEYTFLVFVTPVGPYFKTGFNPVRLLAVEDLDRAAPFGVGDAKVAGNYASGLRGTYRAKENGYAEVIYLDCKDRKYFDESGPANFIAILKDGTYVTPKSSSILRSITNMSLKTIAEKDFGWKVVERSISIDEISDFAEAGCCGTAAVITPVGTIHYRGKDYTFFDNGKTAGPKLTQLYHQLRKINLGEIEDKHHWLYKIKL